MYHGDMSTDDLADALGFTWDRSTVPELPVYGVERALWRFRKLTPQYVWDAAVLEGNPFTFPEVQTLLEGITVGGRNVSDEDQVRRLARGGARLSELVRDGAFRLDKETSDELHGILAQDEALEAGHFRGEGPILADVGVPIGQYGYHQPSRTEAGGANLREQWRRGNEAILGLPGAEPFEQAAAHFLFGAYRQFYFDGNKRTARSMQNGWLMSHGIDAISIPGSRRQEFNTTMNYFYHSADGTAMIAFLASCFMDMG
jgi:Fic family protein